MLFDTNYLMRLRSVCNNFVSVWICKFFIIILFKCSTYFIYNLFFNLVTLPIYIKIMHPNEEREKKSQIGWGFIGKSTYESLRVNWIKGRVILIL